MSKLMTNSRTFFHLNKCTETCDTVQRFEADNTFIRPLCIAWHFYYLFSGDFLLERLLPQHHFGHDIIKFWIFLSILNSWKSLWINRIYISKSKFRWLNRLKFEIIKLYTIAMFFLLSRIKFKNKLSLVITCL